MGLRLGEWGGGGGFLWLLAREGLVGATFWRLSPLTSKQGGELGQFFTGLPTLFACSTITTALLCAGVIGVELEYGDDEEAQIHDAVRVSAKAINSLVSRRNNLSSPPSSCQETNAWSVGEEFYK